MRAFEQIAAAEQSLRDLGVVRSQRTESDYGEWIASQVLKLPMATNRVNKGWDIGDGSRRVQVKTHAKAANTSARRTTLRSTALDFDELAVVLLTPTYRLRSFYLVPRESVEQLFPFVSGKRTIAWRKLADFSVRAIPSTLRPLLSSDSTLSVAE